MPPLSARHGPNRIFEGNDCVIFDAKLVSPQMNGLEQLDMLCGRPQTCFASSVPERPSIPADQPCRIANATNGIGKRFIRKWNDTR